MVNLSIKEAGGFWGIMGDWSVHCFLGKRFRINNNGIKLIAKEDEGLKQVIFDVDKKTIEVVVDNPTLPPHAPRVVDLSSAVDFFEEVRANIETILLSDEYSSVVPNEDRTIFEVK